MTLAEFLTARLDEDQAHARKDLWAVARSTSQGQWEAQYGYNLPHSYLVAGATQVAEFAAHRESPPLADGEDDLHAADVLLAGRMVRAAKPRAERMLREVAAKRAILAAYLNGAEGGITRDCLGFALATMAKVWADHPDYDEELP